MLAVSLVLSAAQPLATQAAESQGALIKGASNASVYYVEDGKRYAFPNEAVFLSWYPDFRTVSSVLDGELASYALAGNVTYRPGSKLVKVTTDPKVYAVSHYGVLRWITTETAAAALYGSDWNTKVHDVPDTFFTNYIVGSPIGAAADYQLSQEQAVMHISDNLRPVNFVPPSVPTTPPTSPAAPSSLSVSASVSEATLHQMVVVFAEVTNHDRPISKIEVYSDQQSSPLMTCSGSTTCSVTYIVSKTPLNARFHAMATDDQGHILKTPPELQAPLTVAAVNSGVMISATPMDTSVGARINLSSDARSLVGITSHKVFMIIPGEPNPVLWKDCGTEALCVSSNPVYRTSQFFSTVRQGDVVSHSGAVTVRVAGSAPKPTLTLLSRPQANQVELRLDAPTGELIGWSSLAEGSGPEYTTVALCSVSSCQLTLQFTDTATYTAFTEVGGKFEASNSLTVSP